VLTLIEKVEQEYDRDVAVKAEQALFEGQFTLEDFLEQMAQVRKMGPLQNLLGMMPGMPKELKDAEIGEKELGRVEAIIRSMTPHERRRPEVINGSRRARIATGSGTSTTEVNHLLKQFKEMSRMMKRFGGAAKGKKGKKRLPSLPGLPSTMDELQLSEERAWPSSSV
jgi:signal recognition particle subunit SRP54